MDIIIDQEGYLSIKRGNKCRHQFCPKMVPSREQDIFMRCGDWCPLFGEPISHEWLPTPKDQEMSLEICCKELCGNLIDNRI